MTTGRFRVRRPAASLGLRSPWAILGLLTLLLLAPALARAQVAGSDTLNLWWTSPGDDGWAGSSAQYDVRIWDQPITDENFTQATPVPGVPLPSPSGRLQHMIVRGLSRGGIYYIALRTRDEADNWSPLSNVVRWSWQFDTAAPATPSGVTASVLEEGKIVTLGWRPNAESDLVGYNVYRAAQREGPYERLNGARLTRPEFRDDKFYDSQWQSRWYQVSAYDAGGIESARSAPMLVRRFGATGDGGWSLASGYPNPSRMDELVHIPLNVPSASSPATVEIVDDAGQRVRVLAIDVPGGGSTELLWDGRNDGGRLVAPGVYRAWLRADGAREVVRLVRLP